MVLIKSDLRGVLMAIHLSRAIVRRIYLNLVWALLYNVVSIPLAAGLLLPWLHTAIPPYIAGAAMALSNVSVLASSLDLKRYKPPNVVNGAPEDMECLIGGKGRQNMDAGIWRQENDTLGLLAYQAHRERSYGGI